MDTCLLKPECTSSVKRIMARDENNGQESGKKKERCLVFITHASSSISYLHIIRYPSDP